MAKKPTTAPKEPSQADTDVDVARPRKNVQVAPGKTPEETRRNIASLVTSPQLAAYRVIEAADKSRLGELIDVPELMSELRRQADAVNRGDLSGAEAMLVNQATTLQSLFARLAERGMSCTEAVPFEVNMRIALRAQSQCRATLETLAAMKNPPMVVARQANVTTGPQQVNNGVSPPRAQEIGTERNKLLEDQDGERLDTRAACPTGGSNQALEAMATLNRPKDKRGKGSGSEQCL